MQLQERVDPADEDSVPRNELPSDGAGNSHRNRSAADILLSFERELRNFNRGNNVPRQAEVSFGDSSHSTPTMEQHSLHSGDPTHSVPEVYQKRQRLDTSGTYNCKDHTADLDTGDTSLGGLPQGKLLDDIIDSYFSQVHPWVPMLQETNFREGLLQLSRRESLEVILHAMVVAALRFVKTDGSMSLSSILHSATQSRKWVVLHAMDILYVENLLALIIVAFDDVSYLIPLTCVDF